jgi:hypothetical protein
MTNEHYQMGQKKLFFTGSVKVPGIFAAKYLQTSCFPSESGLLNYEILTRFQETAYNPGNTKDSRLSFFA